MNRHEQVEQQARPFYLAGIPNSFKLNPIGTNVHLDTADPRWLAESFKPAVTKFFRDWTSVRIQSLTFNGEPIFDYRLWPEPQEVVRDFYGPEPITVKVREANIPEWKER